MTFKWPDWRAAVEPFTRYRYRRAVKWFARDSFARRVCDTWVDEDGFSRVTMPQLLAAFERDYVAVIFGKPDNPKPDELRKRYRYYTAPEHEA